MGRTTPILYADYSPEIDDLRKVFAKVEDRPEMKGHTASEYAQIMREYDARNDLRTYGNKLLELVGHYTVTIQTLHLQRVAQACRANLGEYWLFGKALVTTRLDQLKDGAQRQKVFKGVVAQDDKLLDALKAWAEARVANPYKWAELSQAAHEVADELNTLNWRIANNYGSLGGNSNELISGEYLRQIGLEVAREIAEHFRFDKVDLGNPHLGVIAAMLQASSYLNEKANVEIRLSGELNTGDKKIEQYIKNALSRAVAPSKAAKRTPWVDISERKTTAWVLDLIKSANAWQNLSSNWTRGSDADELLNTTNDLLLKLAAANNAITTANPTFAEKRVAQRAMDALAIGVADRIEELSDIDPNVKPKLGAIAQKIRAQGTRGPTATEPLSEYWQQAKELGKKILPSKDWGKLSDKWFNAGLSAALDKWSDEMDSVPKHDREDLVNYSWAIADALNRYKYGVDILENQDARQQLLDVIDALVQFIYSQYLSALSKWGDQL